jgi:hypothetical protein
VIIPLQDSSNRPKCLTNAVTGQVRTGTDLSCNPTNQALGPSPQQNTALRCKIHRYDRSRGVLELWFIWHEVELFSFEAD